jgi:hypothetical protein
VQQAATATGKCFRTIIFMSDAKHAVLEFRRMHHEGRVKICGEKPVLVFSKGVTKDKEHDFPVFGIHLTAQDAYPTDVAMLRERYFLAELALSARHSDFVLGDANSNVFRMFLETIVARKRVADLPRLVAMESYPVDPPDAVAANAALPVRCPDFDPLLNDCMWLSSVAASFTVGWHSEGISTPYVNGMPRIVEYAYRVGRKEIDRALGREYRNT